MKASVWFYNARVGRRDSTLATEVRALLGDRPLALGLVETVGYDLPTAPGYTLIRDRSTRPRANIAAYIRSDAACAWRWVDLAETWPRTEHPGTHEPRSILSVRVGRMQVVVGHAPPRAATPAARREWWQALLPILDPRQRPAWDKRGPLHRARALLRPRLLLADFNALAGHDHPSQAWLAGQIGGQVRGTRIDAAVVRQVRIDGWAYRGAVGGVRLRSDHKHAFRLDTRIPRHWITGSIR